MGRDRSVLLGLMMSSQERHHADRDWVGIGAGDWDYEGRASWVRLDRVLDVPEEGIRREGAVLDREIFEHGGRPAARRLFLALTQVRAQASVSPA